MFIAILIQVILTPLYIVLYIIDGVIYSWLLLTGNREEIEKRAILRSYQ